MKNIYTDGIIKSLAFQFQKKIYKNNNVSSRT